jgi:hypothetical protein
MQEEDATAEALRRQGWMEEVEYACVREREYQIMVTSAHRLFKYRHIVQNIIPLPSKEARIGQVQPAPGPKR